MIIHARIFEIKFRSPTCTKKLVLVPGFMFSPLKGIPLTWILLCFYLDSVIGINATGMSIILSLGCLF